MTNRVPTPFWIHFDVPEAVVLRLRREQLADVNKLAVAVGFVDDKEYPHEAKLASIAPTVDPKTGTVRFRAIVPNPRGHLLPGMSARVRLTTGLK